MTTFLIEPSVEYEAAYREFIEEFLQAGEKILLGVRPWEEPFAAFVARLRGYAHGIGLPPGWVPSSRYWLVDENGQMLGEIDIRHRLTDALEDYGGHIGYQIRPSQRRRGHGTRMLALGLEKARALGLTRILITCDPDNIASAHLIENSGGRLASQSPNHDGRLTSRYWIEGDRS